MASWFRKPKNNTLAPPSTKGRIPEGLWVKCPKCLETVPRKDWEDEAKACPRCGHHERLGARARIEMLLDPGSFEEHDADLVAGDPLEFKDARTYPERLRENREKTGLTEGAVAGIGRIDGRAVSIAAMDIQFIGGSMGIAVGEKLARALERAIEGRLPAILVCCSGGARMQEGVLSLMQMAKTCLVAGRLHQAGLPLITILTDPTTGGVTASFALVGDVVIAEPQALVGFAGRRVIEATIRQVLPQGFQSAEFLADHGFVDIVCRRSRLRATLANVLSCLMHAETEIARRKELARRRPAARRPAQELPEPVLGEA